MHIDLSLDIADQFDDKKDESSCPRDRREEEEDDCGHQAAEQKTKRYESFDEKKQQLGSGIDDVDHAIEDEVRV